jgi:hypothetical protein
MEKKSKIPACDSELGQIKEAEGGVISFDKLILGGCKFYALTKNKTDISKEICIAKCKGFKQSKSETLTMVDFEQLCKVGLTKQRLFQGPSAEIFGFSYIKGKDFSEGGFKTQKQVQFRCPKQNHVGDGKDFAMTTPTIPKRFGFAYNKGEIHSDGSITPFYY